jgi:hypothetical protein
MNIENSLGLPTLLGIRQDALHAWSPAEFGAILQHQLNASLRLSMGILSAEVMHELAKLPQEKAELRNLKDLFHARKPPVELLQLAKRFAKLCDGGSESPLPREIGMVLYFTSIAVARTRDISKLSSLSEQALARGVEWSCAQDWLDDGLRDLLRKAGPNWGPAPNPDPPSTP